MIASFEMRANCSTLSEYALCRLFLFHLLLENGLIRLYPAGLKGYPIFTHTLSTALCQMPKHYHFFQIPSAPGIYPEHSRRVNCPSPPYSREIYPVLTGSQRTSPQVSTQNKEGG